MMSKASALGLQIDQTMQKQYTVPLDAKYSLDTLRTSWNIVCGFPRVRSIDAGAVIANSVLLRYQHDSSYRPENLKFLDGALDAGYGTVAIVGQPEMVQAAGH